MITCDDKNRKFYTVLVGRCNQMTKFDESLSAYNSFKYLDDNDGGGNIGDLLKKYETESLNVLPYIEETIKLSKKEPSKKSANKPKNELIVPVASISKKEPRKN